MEIHILGGSSHLVSGLVHHSYKWINPTYPIYNWGYNPLTKWDEPPSKIHVPNHQSDEVAMDYTHLTGAFYVGNEGMIHNNYQ